MKKKTFVAIVLVGLLACLSAPQLLKAAAKDSAQRFEVALIRWDGPDKIQYILPDQVELVRLYEKGVPQPKNAQDEEYCLTYAANKLVKEGWEPVNLDGRRMLLRRPVSR